MRGSGWPDGCRNGPTLGECSRCGGITPRGRGIRRSDRVSTCVAICLASTACCNGCSEDEGERGVRRLPHRIDLISLKCQIARDERRGRAHVFSLSNESRKHPRFRRPLGYQNPPGEALLARTCTLVVGLMGVHGVLAPWDRAGRVVVLTAVRGMLCRSWQRRCARGQGPGRHSVEAAGVAEEVGGADTAGAADRVGEVTLRAQSPRRPSRRRGTSGSASGIA